ncbi:Ig-like domain-containing protein [Dyadobacter crusticola]|uniref:Ig-like domain-containing protein n=1 Tax=Dyadobacter crusticola TaxID=292407 RepID=UPI000A06EEFA|nr:SBBP repeat-containing protein [Dyadobacter crusticola]
MQKQFLLERPTPRTSGHGITMHTLVRRMLAMGLALCLFLITQSGLHAQEVGLQWADGFLTAQNCDVQGVATDAAKNVYVTGYFQGTADFNPAAATANLTSAGGWDIFIAKYDQFGRYLWAKRIGAAGDDRGHKLVADPAGNVYVTGYFRETVDFDPNAGVSNLVTTGGAGTDQDAFLLKLDTNGNYVWARRMGSAGNDYAWGLSFDPTGNLIVGGYMGPATATFGTFSLASAGAQDGFVTKINTAGTFLWARRVGGAGSDMIHAVNTDAAGNIYIAGRSGGSTTGIGNIAAGAFVAKLNSSGVLTWSNVSTEMNEFRTVLADATGAVYAGDYSNGTGMNLVKLNPNGTRAWVKRVGTGVSEMALAANNDVYMTGMYSGSATMGSTTLTSKGSSDVYVARMTPAGDFVWARSVGGTGGETNYRMTANQSGEIIVSGTFQQTSDFDPNECVYNIITTGTSGFVIKLSEKPFPDGFAVASSSLTPMTQDACSLGIPQVIAGNAVGVTAPSGYTTTISYQWQKATAATGPWEDMPGEVFKDLQPLSSSETLYYRRLVFAKNFFCKLDSVGASQVATVNIGANTAPIANANGPQWFVCGTGSNTVALNGSATGGTGPYSYQWYTGSTSGAVVGSAANFTTPAVTQATTYTLQVTDAAGCKDIDQVTIVPAIANAGPDRSICQGAGGVQIGTPPVSSPSVSYSWTRVSGAAISTLSCTTCAQPIANPTLATVYRLTVTVRQKSGAICTTTDDVTITPVNAPNSTLAFAGTDKTICKNTSVNLGGTADNTFAYTWTPGQYLSASQVANPVFSAGTAAVEGGSVNYTVSAVKTGCTFTDEVKVSVLNSAITDQNQTICGPAWSRHAGEDNAAGATYTWTVVSGSGTVLQTANSGQDAYLKSNTGVTRFRRTVRLNGVSCTADVLVQACAGQGCDFEIVTLSAQDCPKVFGTTALQLGTTIGDVANYNFSWSPANLVDNYRASSVNITSTSQATITLTVTNKYDASITCSKSIVINRPGWSLPAFPTEDKNTCPNTAVQIGNAPVSGFTYLWQPAAGLSSATVANPTATVASTAQFIVEVTETATGCTNQASVTVNVAAPVADAGNDRTVCNGATVTLGSPAPDGTNWTYSWQPSNAAWTNGTGPTDAQPQVQFAATAPQSFILTVTDPLSNCVAKDTVVLRNTIAAGEYAGAAVTTCQGEPVQLGREAEPFAQYEWFMADGVTPATGLSSNAIANPTVLNPSATTTYVVKVSYPGCTTPATDQVTVTVNQVSGLELTDKNVCPAGPIAIGYGAAGNPAPRAGATYLWAPATGLNSTTAANPTATVTREMTYSVTVTLPSGCVFTDEVKVSPTANAGSDATLCPGESTVIGTTAIAGATYSWTGAGIVGPANVAQPTVRPTVTTTYTVSVTLNGCTVTDQVVVAVNTPANFSITGNTAICEGGLATLSLVGAPAANTTWQWSPVTGVASPNGTSTTVAATSTQTYRLTQTNLTTGCSNYKEVVVVVNPNTIAATVEDIAICGGTSAALPLNVTSSGSYSYAWSPSVGLSNAFIAKPTVTTNSPRTYTVTITDNASQCQLVRSVNVMMRAPEECLAPVSLSGNVFHDANGLKDVTVNTTSPVSIPSELYVTLLDSKGAAIKTVPVNANGSFDFGITSPGTYSIVLHQTAAGSTTPSLPDGWLNMGENLGVGAGSDDAVNGILTNVTVLNVNVTNANFGIEVAPSADPYHRIIEQPVVGQITNLSGNLPELTGSDPEDQPTSGSLSGKAVVITVLPTNTTLLYNGQPVMAGVEIRNFDPLKLQVQFTEETIGDINTSFEYAWVDAAGVQGTPAIYSLEWGAPLPVTLVSFEARIQEGAAMLAWLTTEETNSDRFEVEHSIDGKAWKKVGTVLATGESRVKVGYTFVHPQPVNGQNLYRLKMIDLDETFAYSSIRSVRLDVHSQLTAYPNPVSDRLMVRNYQQIKQVVLHNAAGVKIYQSQKLTSEGIDVSKLQQGSYTITMTLFDGTISTHKVAVIR